MSTLKGWLCKGHPQTEFEIRLWLSINMKRWKRFERIQSTAEADGIIIFAGIWS